MSSDFLENFLAEQDSNQTKSAQESWVNTSDCMLSKLKTDRNAWDKTHIPELAASMQHKKQINPITVRCTDKQKKPYEIISGECRFEAAKLNCEPVLIRTIDCDDTTAIQLMLAENNQRSRPSDYSLALAYRHYLKQGLFKNQKHLAQQCKLSENHVSRLLSIDKIPSKLKNKLQLHKLSAATFNEIAILAKKGPAHLEALLAIANLINSGIGWETLQKTIAKKLAPEAETTTHSYPIRAQNNRRVVLGELKPSKNGFSFQFNKKVLKKQLSAKQFKALQSEIAVIVGDLME